MVGGMARERRSFAGRFGSSLRPLGSAQLRRIEIATYGGKTAEHRSAATDGFYRPEFGLKCASGDRLRLVGSLLPQFQSGTQEGRNGMRGTRSQSGFPDFMSSRFLVHTVVCHVLPTAASASAL
jgi:hypothetical protein